MSYTIDALHFYELSYAEGDHAMRIEIDLRDPVPCVYKRSIARWEPPHEDESLSDAKKEEIVQRVEHFLTQVKQYPQVMIDRG